MPQRIITTPIRVTGSVYPEQISSLLAIDSWVRRLRQLGESTVEWELSTLAGDVAVQRAVERAVVREGDHPEAMDTDNFVERAKKLEQEAEADLAALLSALDIETSLDRWGVHGELASRAARIAFVRLFEAGALARATTVVDACPGCSTVVDESDTDLVESEVEHVRLAFSAGPEVLGIDLYEPELLVGAVAIAIPESSELEAKSVRVPLIDDELPLVRIDGIESTRLVVPAHDPWSFEVAQTYGYDVIDVLDSEGVVIRDGPLEGLGRFAARSAVVEQLESEGAVLSKFDAPETIRKCHRCSTTIVPMYGVHWVLSFDTLVGDLIEVLDTGVVSTTPESAIDRLRELATKTETWCISQQLRSGHRIPVSTCLDCNQTTVSVDDHESCGACMGTLEPHDDILDARFIAAIVPLAMSGWPDDRIDAESPSVTLSVGRSGLENWALPIAALGLRLAGHIPFEQLTVHRLPVGSPELGPQMTSELTSQVLDIGTAAARAMLLLGDDQPGRAHDLANDLANPRAGEGHIQDSVETYDVAVHSLEPGTALRTLQSAARSGLDEESRRHLATLVQPLLAR